MTRKRSRYRPRPVNPLAHWVAVQGTRLLTKDDALAFALPVREAVAAVCQGRASEDHWAQLLRALAITGELVRTRVARDADGVLAGMRSAALDILEREVMRGTRALYPQEVAALDGFAAAYADLICQVTLSELEEADWATKKYPRTD